MNLTYKPMRPAVAHQITKDGLEMLGFKTLTDEQKIGFESVVECHRQLSYNEGYEKALADMQALIDSKKASS